MAKEVIVINEPDESGCNVCALDKEELGEYCACALCGDCHFIDIESHE